MAALKELRYLRDEERLITGLLAQLKDTLNRLKVEELSLRSTIREKNLKMTAELSGASAQNVENKDQSQDYSKNEEQLDLDVEKTLQALAAAGLDVEIEYEDE